MKEIISNIHMHTVYSDGHTSHSGIVESALKTGVDVVIVTDHNVYVEGVEGYYFGNGDQKVLLLVGEEIHDQGRQPQKNHLLVIGANQELAYLASDMDRLLEAAKRANGLAFVAHPVDPAAPAINEVDLSWMDWEIRGIHGIELWNAMSEFKARIKSKLQAIYYVFNPDLIAQGPFPEALAKWDEMLIKGRHIVVIGGTDAHVFPAKLGFLRKTVFPLKFHFQTINTHLFIQEEFNGELEHDRSLVLESLEKGRAFIGYDLPASTNGFRFVAHGTDTKITMGDEISARNGVTFQIRLPQKAECRLIKDGEIQKIWYRNEMCTYITTQPGVYRVESYIEYRGQKRGWIFSNPIYVNE